MTTRFTASLFCLVIAAAPIACGTAPPDSKTTPETTPAAPPPSSTPAASAGTASNGHEHTAPHGGALVEIGDEFAHVELVLAASAGTLTAYALDGEAENAVRLSQAALDLVIERDGASPFALALKPVANELTGERLGDTSQFAVTAPELRGLAHFDGRVRVINIRGQEFHDVAFRFPEGSDHR